MGAVLRDAEIRIALRRELARKHAGEGETLIVEELGLCHGIARADMAVVNGHLTGYEIKSDADDFTRLPAQKVAYNKIFDQVVLVLGANLPAPEPALVPEWWGIARAHTSDGNTEIVMHREPSQNPAQEPRALAQLLWQDETLSVLEALDAQHGVASKPKRFQWDRLVEQLSPDVLKEVVQHHLRSRSNWVDSSGSQRGNALNSNGQMVDRPQSPPRLSRPKPTGLFGGRFHQFATLAVPRAIVILLQGSVDKIFCQLRKLLTGHGNLRALPLDQEPIVRERVSD